ncbi:MAG: T9SS type A sorting domain-containing protein, partial [Bacteroidota bacterium]
AVELTPEEGIVAGATGVSNEADEALTGSHRISAVYPNPFTDQASLNLEVARSQDVDIAVYNLLGQRVATLANETLAAGEVHEFELNGRNLPSGLYVIRAQGAEFSDTVRVTVAH